MQDFIAQYGTTILYAIITGVFAWLGVKAKSIADKYVDSREKKEVAKTVVRAVEQIYKDLHGEEKLDKALTSASEMLAAKGITVTDLELRMLIEAAVNEFNGAFAKDEETVEVMEEAVEHGFPSQIGFVASGDE